MNSTDNVITVSVNNQGKQCHADQSLSELLGQWGYQNDKVAVAVNGDFVPRSYYGETALQAGDQVDVLAPVQGG